MGSVIRDTWYIKYTNQSMKNQPGCSCFYNKEIENSTRHLKMMQKGRQFDYSQLREWVMVRLLEREVRRNLTALALCALTDLTGISN